MAWVYRQPPPRPRRVPWIPSATADQTIAVGVASESEAAVAVGIDLTILVGTVNEIETAQAVPSEINVTVGTATETEAAQIIGIGLGVGQAAEVEAANVVATGGTQSIAVGRAAESETAQPIVLIYDQTILVVQVAEFEAARPVVNPDTGLGINPFQNNSLASVFLVSPLKLDSTAGRNEKEVRFVGWFFKGTAAEAHILRESLLTIMNDLQEVKITYDAEPGFNGTYFIRRARVDSAKIGPGLYKYQIDAQYVGAL